MKFCKSFVIFFMLIVSNLSIAQQQYDGLWTGKIAAGGVEMQMDFEIKSEEQKLLLSVPIQGLKDVESSSFNLRGDTLEAVFSMFRSRYDAIYNAETELFEGNWLQGISTPLDIKRTTTKTEFKRPQTPTAPFPYNEEEVIIENKNAGVTLSGTLTRPKGEGPYPLAILVSGSGRQNRNSNILGHEPFLVIADHLTRAGIAVLRYDDRGVEKSTGNHSQATTADFASDAKAIVDYARGLDQIDKAKIGIIGHSEGGMIAPLVASQTPDLGYIVSLAGPAVPISELMTYQNMMVLQKSGMTYEGLKTTEENLPKIYSIVNQDKEPKQIFDTLINAVHYYYDLLSEADQKLLAPSKQNYYMQLSQSFFSPWFSYFLEYDPTESWQNVKCPVLAVNGSEDIQVEATTNTEAIKANLKIAKNKNSEVEIIEGMNHLFQPCDKCDLSEYATIETTIDNSVLEKIRVFILGLK